MKTIRTLLLAIVAFGVPAVTVLAVNNRLSADIALAILAAAGLVAFAGLDYTRDVSSVRACGKLLRPALPVANVSSTPMIHSVRRAA
jgi:hypothetical protein